MQDAVYYRIAQSLSKDYEPPPLGDYGFYHDVGDVELWAHYLTQYGVLPYSGGLLDQPDAILEDIGRYLGIRARVSSR